LRSSPGFAAFIEAHSNRPKPVSFGEGAEGHSQTAYDLLRISSWALVIIGALPVIVGLIGKEALKPIELRRTGALSRKRLYSVPTFSRMESVEAVQTTEPAARSLAPSAARSLPLRSRPSRLAIALGANEQRRRARPLSSAGRRQRDDCLPRRDAPRAESAAARFARKARAKPVSLGHGPADGLAADSMLMEATDQSVRKLTLTAARRYGLWSVASHRNCAIGMSS
jgi:hypothetical protein